LSNKTPAQFYFEKVQFLKLVQLFLKIALSNKTAAQFYFEKVKIFKLV